MERGSTHVCGLLVGLDDVEVFGVDGALGEPLGVHFRGLYDIGCAQLADTYAIDLAGPDCPPELRRLGRTLARWRTRIVNWRRAGCRGSAVSGAEDGVGLGLGVGWQA